MDPISAGIMAGGSLLGGYLGSQGSQTKSGPPKYVKKAQKQQYAEADAAYQKAAANAPTQFYAPMDAQTAAGIKGINDYATGAGKQLADTVAGAGTTGLTQGQAGQLGAAGGLYAASSTDPTQANINSAGKYADNPYLNGLIDASSRDVVRNLTEQVLPGIGRLATMGGNGNSTRTGIAEGIALRGAQDRIGDISSQIRSGAWDTGLQTAEQARQANLGGMQAAGGLYGNAASTGLNAAAQGSTLNYNNLDAMVAAGQISQADAQGIINGQIQGNQYQLDLLAKKGAATGLNSVSPGTVTQSGGGVSGALQGATGVTSAGLGLYKAYNNFNNGVYGGANNASNPNFNGGLY